MQFVDYDSSQSGISISKTNNMIRLESKLSNNEASFQKHYSEHSIKFNNSHTLSKMCTSVAQYTGKTPQDTYENVKERLRYITNLFGIAYPGVSQETQSILFSDDMLVHKSLPVSFSSGKLVSGSRCFKLYNHDNLSIRLSDYMKPITGFGLFVVDLPLLAALQHQYMLDSELKGELTNRDRFITEVFTLKITTDIINIALLNRFALDAQDFGASGYEESFNRVPYLEHSTFTEYKAAMKDYGNYFKQFKRSSLGDLYNNLPILDGGDSYLINIKDYYMDQLMWINAYSDIGMYNKLLTLNEGYSLGLTLDTHTNRLRKLLGRGKAKQIISHLDPRFKEHVSKEITQEK